MNFLVRIAVVAAALLAAGTSVAQSTASYPTRPVRLVVPFAPGGTNDAIARIIAEKLALRLGQPVVVDNRGGANMVVGSEIVVRANPDGHTILIVGAGYAVNPSLRRKLPYDSLRDFAPIGLVASGPYVMVVHPSVPAKTVGEFIAWVRSRPGQVNYASTGTGSPPHLAAELFKVAAALDMQHIPYKGGGAVLPDLLGGRVSLFFGSVSTLKPQVQAGKLRGIAVTTTKRSPAMPELPTFIESGVKGYEVTGWYGLLAPGKTPPAILDRLNRELQQVLNDADARKRLARRGLEAAPGTAADFSALIRSEIPKWAKVMQAAGVKPE
ncbi:MAG: tripartite tricarboxylate transporter substrate binding protein [Betaproteobacteria bacterium]|nr:MAG: tripartite tricarboxylate transporter substrate binding protein [Betaproteobacteria bacterium]